VLFFANWHEKDLMFVAQIGYLDILKSENY